MIEIAQQAGCFDQIMVSTEDDEIAELAKTCGADVPFLRSAATSGDTASTMSVIFEVLECFRRKGREFDACCCLFPTAVFAEAHVISEGLNMLQEEGGLHCVMPVVEFEYPISRALTIADDRLYMVAPELERTRSQDCAPAFHDAGQWYWFRVSRMHEGMQVIGSSCRPIVLPAWKVQDIDTEEHWRLAEIKYRCLEQIGSSGDVGFSW